jgi:D-serine dehydratase
LTQETLARLRAATPQLWINPLRNVARANAADPLRFPPAGMHAARDRFTRFAPLLAQLFPELAESRGQIESALLPVPALQKALDLPDSQGRLWGQGRPQPAGGGLHQGARRLP